MQTYAEVGYAPVKARDVERYRIVIIGGGTAGITVAAQLARKGVHDIAIIEPSPKHYYQPLWTLVGAGVVPVEQSVRDEARYIPKGVRWIQDYAVEIDPRPSRWADGRLRGGRYPHAAACALSECVLAGRRGGAAHLAHGRGCAQASPCGREQLRCP